VHDSDGIIAVLDELSALGVRLAVDDIGGGISSLSVLSRLPVDVLKISPSASSPKLIRATVALATALGMSVTAQSIASSDQSARLALLGCRHAQGPLYGKPVDADSVPRLLTSLEHLRVAA